MIRSHWIPIQGTQLAYTVVTAIYLSHDFCVVTIEHCGDN